jgi:hypothetical protein
MRSASFVQHIRIQRGHVHRLPLAPRLRECNWPKLVLRRARAAPRRQLHHGIESEARPTQLTVASTKQARRVCRFSGASIRVGHPGDTEPEEITSLTRRPHRSLAIDRGAGGRGWCG